MNNSEKGAKCYLNSLQQELFMSKEMIEAVERHNSYIDQHLKNLFIDLERGTAYTYNIIKELGIDRAYEQHDAAEYFEKILTQTSPRAARMFQGQLTHSTACSKCGTQKCADSRVWHLPLPLMDSHSKEYRVADGIEEYFRDSHFSGQDQMYCDHCDDKADVTVKCAVKHYPEVLVLLLKRFEFDYRYMRYVKNHCDVIIPFTLQIPENQTYELYAVVDHVGDTTDGHHAAIIKSQDDDQWYIFNDSSVGQLDFQPFQVDITERSQSAYLLFYRKKTSLTQNVLQTYAHPAAYPKYHGLINHGATCYLNSVLQVLFMTKEFRGAVNRYNTFPDHLLIDVFDEVHRHTTATFDFINNLGINRVYDQRDAAQYFESILPQTVSDASQTNQGHVTHKTTCCKCQTGRSSDSRVWHLPLTLVDSHSEEYRVVDGLKEYLRDPHFTGQDQKFCDQCGVSVDVITKHEVQHHPEVLVLLLKRFEFDHTNLAYVKNNRSVDFPATLQITQDLIYEVFAAVMHNGDVRDGHYAAAMKSPDNGLWFNLYEPTHTLLKNQPFQVDQTEKSQIAYLLFYRKQETLAADTSSQDVEESTSGSFPPATIDSYNMSEDSEMMKQREEIEDDVEDELEEFSLTESEEKCYDPDDPTLIFVDTEDELDFFYEGFESPRALMSCGHAVTPTSLTNWCLRQLDEGKTRFVCGQTDCNAEWSYEEVCKMALLTPREQKHFEKTMKSNVAKRNTKPCPVCKSPVLRSDQSNLRVHCSVCAATNRRIYEFCWQCLREWRGPAPRSDHCDNDGCSNESLKTLQTCPDAVFEFEDGVSGCPSMRACPTCGILLQHDNTGCKNVVCPRCEKEFCFVCLKLTDECEEYEPWPCSVAPRQTSIPVW